MKLQGVDEEEDAPGASRWSKVASAVGWLPSCPRDMTLDTARYIHLLTCILSILPVRGFADGYVTSFRLSACNPVSLA